MILALDPGHIITGWVKFDGQRVIECGILDNRVMLDSLMRLHDSTDLRLAVEMIASYGMPVGREIFETVRWIGRFQQVWRSPEDVEFVYRRDVKLELCGDMRAKDPNIRQALINRIGPVGTKKNKGPLYGVKGDIWAALGVAVYAHERHRRLHGR